MSKPTILLADDHTLVLEGLARLLEPDYEIVGTSPDGRALIADALRLKPDLILLDISMPQLTGIEAARQLRNTLTRDENRHRYAAKRPRLYSGGVPSRR